MNTKYQIEQETRYKKAFWRLLFTAILISLIGMAVASYNFSGTSVLISALSILIMAFSGFHWALDME